MSRRIVGVAFKRPGSGLLVTLDAPHRHHHIIEWLAETGHGGKWSLECDQGFVDDRGNWLSREDALKLATENGQLKLPRPPTHNAHELFSEDLW